MKKFKEKLIKVINALPDSDEAAFEHDYIEAFPQLMENIFSKKRELYNASQFKKIEEESPFMFTFLINKIADAIKIQEAWLRENETTFNSNELNEFSKTLVQGQAGKLNDLANKLKEAKEKITKIHQQNDTIGNENTLLESKEAEYKSLLNNQDQLKQRKADLEKLRDDVKAGKLEELAAEIKSLEGTWNEKEKRRTELQKRKEEALSKQKKQEQDIQAIVSHTAYIGKAKPLFEEIGNKCRKHNEDIFKEHKEAAENLKIQLDFTQATSTELIDGSLDLALKKAQQNLEEVEAAIKNKISLNY